MNYLITIEHPAWAHQFRPVIEKLIDKGQDVKVLVIDQEVTSKLLDKFGIKYVKIGNSTGSNILEKVWIFFHSTLSILWNSFFFKTDVFIGRASPMVAIASFLLRKPHIIYEDTERSTIALWFCKKISKIIITPKFFNLDLGDCHVRTDSFKELFYLHKNTFIADPGVLDNLGLSHGENFVLIRYIAWNASHDMGEHGFSDKTKIKLVHEISKTHKVFVSSEKELPEELMQYELKTDVHKIHDVLYYSSLFISESGTMSTEACVLGVPVVYVATIAKKLGNFVALKEEYDLLDFYDNEEDGLAKIRWVLSQKNFKELQKKKLENLYKDKIDILGFYLAIISNFNINQLKDGSSEILKFKREF
jgi:uncharacterized protein